MQEPLFWSCHVCHDLRPDPKISVVTHHRRMAYGVEFDENIRYCNDRPACIEGAKTVRFMSAAEDVEGTPS